jgi:Tfp pilus assembly protein PilX
MGKRGMALYVVLTMLLMLSILASIILNFVSSQSSLSNHQIKRIQAYYAAQAGINYALELLRLNNVTYDNGGNGGNFRICGNDYSSTHAAICGGLGNITETSLPASINYVDLFIGPVNPAFNNRTVNATVNYTANF